MGFRDLEVAPTGRSYSRDNAMTPSKPTFPLRLFALAFVFSITTTLLGGALSWQMDLRGHAMVEKHITLTQNIGHIMLLNENIAMSARMAAATGDVGYEQRHDRLIQQLAPEIDTLRAVLPKAEIASFVAETDASSLAMGKMEQQAFVLARQGKRQEAMALLNGDEYMRLEKVYADGLAKAAQAAGVLIEHEHRHMHLLTLGLALLSAVVAAILLATWFLALRAARRWEVERKTAALTLERANEKLEVRVFDRTSELQTEVALHAAAETHLQHANRALRVITHANAMISHDHDETVLLADVCKALVEDGGYRLCWVGVPQQDAARSVRVLSCAGVEQATIEAAQVSWDEARGAGCPVGSAIRSGAPALLRDALNDPDYAPWRGISQQLGFASVLALPLLLNTAEAPVLCVYAPEADAFDDDEVMLLTQLAADVAHAINALRAQDALAKAEQQVSLLLESLPLILYTCRAEGDFGATYISPNVERVTGYPAERLTGDAAFWGAHIYPDDQKRVHDGLAKLFKRPSLKHEYRWQIADGSYRWFLDVLYLVRHADGTPSHIVGAWLDIDERKQAEIALQASEVQFRTLYESSHDAIMTLDPGNGFVGSNPATLTLFGCRDEQEFKRLSPATLSPEFQPDGRRSDEKAQEMIGLAMEIGANYFEWTHLHTDGTEFYADVLLTRMEIDGRKLLQATVRDITARKQNEQALAVAQRNLQSAYDLIVRRNAQLQESTRARSEFLAAMSHELKTPLNAIIGFSDVLKDGIAGPVSEEQRGFAQDIYDAGIKLLGLLSDIIDFSRLEAGHARLELKPVQADVWLTESVMPWRERATASGLTFALDIPEPLAMLWLDAAKARQIVVCLLSNAVKFTPAGGAVTLTARRVVQAQVQARVAGDILPDAFAQYLQIEVRNSGIGFPPELLPKLFEPFHQGDASSARQYEGIGLGLAMVRSLVDLHGGVVQAFNAPDHGACLTVWLPWRENVADQESAAQAADNPLLALLIEDDPKAAELIRLQLESEGLQVITAGTAAQGLQLAETQHPALITLDILLPDMDGWALLEQLKSTPTLAHIPVVVISIVADQKRGMTLGAASVIQKPYKHEELYEALIRVRQALNSAKFDEMMFMNEVRRALNKHERGSGL